jgi:hypothetical protein
LDRATISDAGHDVGVIPALTDHNKDDSTRDKVLELHDASRMTLSPRAA